MKTSFLVALFAAVAFARSEREYKSAFLGWMKQHGRSYDATEFQQRYSVFRGNYDFVQNWNGDFQVALNEFADLQNSEFVRMYTGLNLIVDPASLNPDAAVDLSTTPTSVDWRQKGAVTPIKNQGQCGSCWSFSTTGSVEGCHQMATGTLVSFSEQNLVDCSTAEGNEGCNGGLMDDAFQYIIKNGGLDTEASYPYTATGPNACKYKAANSGGTITAFTDVTSGSEAALITAAAQAPISVAIDASHNSFQFYSSGIYYEPQCSTTQLDHGVLVVGYGVQTNTTHKVAAAPGASPTSSPTTSGTPPTTSGTPPTTSGTPPTTSGTPPTTSGTPPTTSGTPPTTSGTPPTTSGTPAPPSPSNGEYYIVKNSWGTTWGQAGYIWMSRNRNNNCGIATSASFPTGCK